MNSDFIPTYKSLPTDWEPSGRRVKRGLYVTNNGIALNADINGSYNILVKAFPNAFGIGERSGVSYPKEGKFRRVCTHIGDSILGQN